eukprot:TRINITY_DN538_c0_g1_i2.p1 TRINITY_DN538_c0_g1~~TRINITY_DN538_c0_g1_i2.p1  ORF type:complete len:263 (+),score=59.98 TRINITY_DN538_c0_g1_i2:230-1018(+)
MVRASLRRSSTTPATPSSSLPSSPYSPPSSPSSSHETDDDYCSSSRPQSKKKNTAANKSAHKLRDMILLLKDNDEYAASCYKRMPRPNGSRTRRPLTNDLLAFCRAMVKVGLVQFKTALDIYPNWEEKLLGMKEMDFSTINPNEPKSRRRGPRSSSRRKSSSSKITTSSQSPTQSPTFSKDNISTPSSALSSPQQTDISNEPYFLPLPPDPSFDPVGSMMFDSICSGPGHFPLPIEYPFGMTEEEFRVYQTSQSLQAYVEGL